MLNFNLRSIATVLFVATASSSLVSAACASSQVELCCRTFAPYSDNAYVYKNICGIVEDPDTPMGAFCEVLSSSAW